MEMTAQEISATTVYSAKVLNQGGRGAETHKYVNVSVRRKVWYIYKLRDGCRYRM